MSRQKDEEWASFVGIVIVLTIMLVAILGKLYLGKLVAAFVGALPEIFMGAVVSVVVIASGFLLLGIASLVIEVRERRAAQLPAYLWSVPLVAPMTLRWVRGLLPGDEGAAWLAEVTSCLAETPDKGERRQYVRSYRRAVPWLVWTSWKLYFSGSQSRELS